jgi:hypothetical protein
VRATSRHDDQHHTCGSPSPGDRDDNDDDNYNNDDDDASDHDDGTDHDAATDDMRGCRCIHSVAAGMAGAV